MFALGAAVFGALGIAVTAFTTTTDSASTVGPFAVVMLSFISGVFISVETLRTGWRRWARSSLYHVAEGLQTVMVSGQGGTGLAAGNIAVLAIWG